MYLTRIALILALLTPFLVLVEPTTAQGVPSKFVLSNWSETRESRLRMKVLYAPRLLKHAGEFIARSRTMTRLYNLVAGTANLVTSRDRERLTQAGYRISDSILNPLGTFNNVVSDVATLSKTLSYARAPLSTRIQLCTGNISSVRSGYNGALGAIAPLDPLLHVGILIDDREEFSDEGGGGLDEMRKMSTLGCTRVPLLKNEPEQVAVERLSCIARNYKPDWSIFVYNCAGFTRDILEAAGLGYPALPNLGIGANFPIMVKVREYRENRKKRTEMLKSAAEHCDDHVVRLRNALFSLEQGAPVSEANLKALSYEFFGDRAVRNETILQIYVSAAQGPSDENRQSIEKFFAPRGTNFPLGDNSETNLYAPRTRYLRGYYLRMFQSLTPQAELWLQTKAPAVWRFYQKSILDPEALKLERFRRY